MVRWIIVPWALVLMVVPSSTAGSLEISYNSLERIVRERFLTEGGRRYFEGGPSDTCNYAFIQEPRVSASESRLHFRFLFAGSVGKQVGERCVGSGDNFDIVVSGVPRFADGELFLDEMTIEGESRVFSLFSGLLDRVLGPMMRVPVRQEIETVIGHLVVNRLVVEEITAGEHSVTMKTDVELSLVEKGSTP